MGSDGNRKLAFALGFIAHYAVVFVCTLPYWKVSNWQSSDGLYGRIPTFDGIWWHCMSLKTGGFSCNNYGKPSIYSTTDIQACRALVVIATIFSFFAVIVSLLSLDCTSVVEPETKAKNTTALIAGICYVVAAELQAQRALMVIAVVLSFLGLIIGIISLQCTTMIENSSRKKSAIGIASGLCFFLTALSVGLAVSWFAWKVTYEYYSPYYQEKEFKYEFGACLYVGWVATLFGAFTLFTTIWFGVNVHRRYYDPAYKNDSFQYEYGACLYVGWVTGALTVISGLVLIIGSCKDMKDSGKDSYQPAKPYVYKPPASSFVKSSGEKAEYV